MKRLASIVLWTAIALYGGVGLAGVLFGPTELAPFLPRASIDPTVFNQLRFFKALELSMAVAFFALRRRVHDDAFAQRFVAFVLWVTPLARCVSMISDGLPSLSFRLLAGVELLGALVFTAYAASPPAHRAGVARST